MSTYEVYEEAYKLLPKHVNPLVIVEDFIRQETKKREEYLRVLEHGVEVGTWPKHFYREFERTLFERLEFIGVDTDREALLQTPPYVVPIRCSVTNLAFPSNTFDLEYSVCVLPWIEKDMRYSAVKETERTLKFGGKAMFITPAHSHLKEELVEFPKYTKKAVNIDELRKKFFIGKEKLEKYALEAGMQISELYEVEEVVPVTPKQRIALLYSDTLAPSQDHDESAFKEYLSELASPSRINFCVVVVEK
jgi:SAM-dependent methyltransferase